MNHTSKERLLKVVTYFRRKNCCYDGLMFEREPPMCDCKYGIHTDAFYTDQGEQTGCPELRTVEALLCNITDEELEEITHRHITKETIEEIHNAVKEIINSEKD